MLANKWSGNWRQRGRSVGDGGERRVVDAAQFFGGVERIRRRQDRCIVRFGGANYKLRTLTAGREAQQGAASICLRLGDVVAHTVHGRPNLHELLVGCEPIQVRLVRQLYIHADAIGPSTRLGQQLGCRVGNEFEVDVAGKAMASPKCARHVDQLLHGVVRAANDARAEEQSFFVSRILSSDTHRPSGV